MARVVKTETGLPALCCTSTNQMGWMKSTGNAPRTGGGRSIDRSRRVRAQLRRRDGRTHVAFDLHLHLTAAVTVLTGHIMSISSSSKQQLQCPHLMLPACLFPPVCTVWMLLSTLKMLHFYPFVYQTLRFSKLLSLNKTSQMVKLFICTIVFLKQGSLDEPVKILAKKATLHFGSMISCKNVLFILYK